ncbi:hypothetical protein F3D15_16105, partial [Bacteroides ovatus]
MMKKSAMAGGAYWLLEGTAFRRAAGFLEAASAWRSPSTTTLLWGVRESGFRGITCCRSPSCVPACTGMMEGWLLSSRTITKKRPCV